MIVDGEVGVIKSHTLSRQVRTIERILLLPQKHCLAKQSLCTCRQNFPKIPTLFLINYLNNIIYLLKDAINFFIRSIITEKRRENTQIPQHIIICFFWLIEVISVICRAIKPEKSKRPLNKRYMPISFKGKEVIILCKKKVYRLICSQLIQENTPKNNSCKFCREVKKTHRYNPQYF